jgi:hypothetical protein
MTDPVTPKTMRRGPGGRWARVRTRPATPWP